MHAPLVVGLRRWAGVCCVCLWWFPALLPDCFCILNHRASAWGWSYLDPYGSCRTAQPASLVADATTHAVKTTPTSQANGRRKREGLEHSVLSLSETAQCYKRTNALLHQHTVPMDPRAPLPDRGPGACRQPSSATGHDLSSAAHQRTWHLAQGAEIAALAAASRSSRRRTRALAGGCHRSRTCPAGRV